MTRRAALLSRVVAVIAGAGCVVVCSAVGACGKPPPSEVTREAAAASAVAPSVASGAAIAPASGAKLTLSRPPDDAELASWLRSERLRAKADGRVLVLYAGAPWCGPCRKFHEALHGGAMDQELSSVAIVELDADKDRDRLSTAGYAFKFIPFVALVAADGSPRMTHQIEGGGNANAELVRHIRGFVAEAMK